MKEDVDGDIEEPLLFSLSLSGILVSYFPAATCIRYFHAFNYIENPFKVENRLIFQLGGD